MPFFHKINHKWNFNLKSEKGCRQHPQKQSSIFRSKDRRTKILSNVLLSSNCFERLLNKI